MTSASQHDRLLDTLGRAITDGDLPPGSVLRAEQTMVEHGASRSVVREAVRVLESMGMVTTRRRVGTTVAETDRWQALSPLLLRWRLDGPGRTEALREIGELRGAVEPLAASLAATRITPDDADRLSAAYLAMSRHGRAADLAAFLDADVEFHAILLRSAGNALLADLTSVVAEVLAGRTRHDLMPERPRAVAMELHHDVARHVVAGDSVSARAAMQALVDEAADAVAPRPVEG